ncbi:hypothetical protein C8F01DRAFT_1365661 [Mycena amicta]|nr:hypothetical protein C8F01DRAFT_1365661 [Mycena amicta]
MALGVVPGLSNLPGLGALFIQLHSLSQSILAALPGLCIHLSGQVPFNDLPTFDFFPSPVPFSDPAAFDFFPGQTVPLSSRTLGSTDTPTGSSSGAFSTPSNKTRKATHSSASPSASPASSSSSPSLADAAAFRVAVFASLQLRALKNNTKKAHLAALDRELEPFLLSVPQPRGSPSHPRCTGHDLASVTQNKGRAMKNLHRIGDFFRFCKDCNISRYVGTEPHLYDNNPRVKQLVDARREILNCRKSSCHFIAATEDARVSNAADGVKSATVGDDVTASQRTACDANDDVFNVTGPVVHARREPSPALSENYMAASPPREMPPRLHFTRDLVMPAGLQFEDDNGELIGESSMESAGLDKLQPLAKQASRVISIPSSNSDSDSSDSCDTADSSVPTVLCLVGYYHKRRAPIVAQVTASLQHTTYGCATVCLADYLEQLQGTGFPIHGKLRRYLPGMPDREWVKYKLTDRISVAPRDDVIYIRAQGICVTPPRHIWELKRIRETLVL